MREIKFRGMPTFGKEFVYGYYNVYVGEGKTKHEIITNENGLTRYEVLPKSVGQFTGLKDKNGKEIFEGDILRYNYHIEYGENWKGSRENEDFIGIVEYHDKILEIGCEHDKTRFIGFILCGHKGTDDEYYVTIPNLQDIEVIGNIYKNPELLEVSKCQ